MTIPLGTDPDYDPANWSLGYQGRQFGLSGTDVATSASVLSGLADPPAAMIAAAEVVSGEDIPVE